MSHHTSSSKDAALIAVGRTIVNFQRLEHNLKIAARLAPVNGTLQKIQRDLERRVERTATWTLGQAIQAWINVAEAKQDIERSTPDLFDATIGIAITPDLDVDSLNAHTAALKALLDTRNKLIHGGLVHFKWDSPEDCDRLVAELNQVNSQISPQLDFVTSLLNGLKAITPLHWEEILMELERHEVEALGHVSK